MTPADLYPLIREDADRRPFTGEAVATDEEVEASPSGTVSDEELLPLVWTAADAVAAAVDARHIPDRIATRAVASASQSLTGADLRLLPTRVRGERLAGAFGEDAGPPVSGWLERVSERAWARRGPLAGAFAVSGGVVRTDGAATEYDVVESPSARGAADDLGLPAEFEHAVVLHALAAVWASRGDGRAVTALNGFRRAVAPYRAGGEADAP